MNTLLSMNILVQLSLSEKKFIGGAPISSGSSEPQIDHLSALVHN
jgi:hypothetical protein